MFCTNCGAQIANNVNFCPECGARVEYSHQSITTTAPAPQKVAVTPPPPPKPKPVCKDKEEENFYRTHCGSIDGLREYVAKYPKGFYWLEAQSRISENERKWRKVRKVLRLIAVIIGAPFFAIHGLTTRSWGAFIMLINWYRKAETRDI